MLFDTQIKGRVGSPNVAGSTSRLSAGTSRGSASDTDRRPPPARRTRRFASGSPSRSSSPRLIVERASPVTFETRARPPRPALRTPPPPQTTADHARQAARRPSPIAAESPPRRSCDRTTLLRNLPESPTPESFRRRKSHRDSVIVRGDLSSPIKTTGGSPPFNANRSQPLISPLTTKASRSRKALTGRPRRLDSRVGVAGWLDMRVRPSSERLQAIDPGYRHKQSPGKGAQARTRRRQSAASGNEKSGRICQRSVP